MSSFRYVRGWTDRDREYLPDLPQSSTAFRWLFVAGIPTYLFDSRLRVSAGFAPASPAKNVQQHTPGVPRAATARQLVVGCSP